MMNTATTLEWAEICHIDDIPRLGARVVRHAEHEPVAIFRAADNRLFAVIDRCPHQGGPLSAGLMHGHAVTCPLHNWVINLEDGQAHAPDEGCARSLRVKVEAETVYLRLPPRS